ncbi:MAG: peptidoglycan editing factor PgeF [Clostridia bacterium]|nr:peptidoglycan editing factor PgeF [Clostridia bacterium]
MEGSIIYEKKDNFEYIKIKELEKYKNLECMFSLKPHDFKKKEDNFKEIEEKYNNLCKSFGVKGFVVPKQTHSINVKEVESASGLWPLNMQNVDALVTNKKGIMTSLVFADCMPVGFYDPVKNVIANVHSGWKGTLNGIISETLKFMNERFNSKNEDIVCIIGPTIRACHFEVQDDVRSMFYEKYKYLDNINEIIKLGRKENDVQKYNIDATLLNKTIMKNLGIKEENIIDINICTVCENDKFHSYRKEKENSGRFTCIMYLK